MRTPGPWTVENEGWILARENGETHSIAYVPKPFGEARDRAADARAIAALPAIIEASLKHMKTLETFLDALSRLQVTGAYRQVNGTDALHMGMIDLESALRAAGEEV